jgi:hypothetical protein
MQLNIVAYKLPAVFMFPLHAAQGQFFRRLARAIMLSEPSFHFISKYRLSFIKIFLAAS